MRKLKTLLKILLIFVLIIFVGIGAALYYFTISDYQPVPSEDIPVRTKTQATLPDSTEFTLLTWNIGYCGLDKQMDFFYEGGKKVRPDKNAYQKNLNHIYDVLLHNDTIDFILLQEVDTFARRSYFTNQLKLFADALPTHSFSFAENYKVKFVPVPVYNPMGQVISGICTFSRVTPSKSQRFSFPLNYSWPMKLFMLDRCFLLQRYPMSNGKELIVINTHNSAFSDADLLRQYELWMLRSFVLYEYHKGNYVIVGGDWNLNPDGYNHYLFSSGYLKKRGIPQIPKDFMPKGWQWATDTTLPTNRDVYEAYRHGSTTTTIYDFFLVSPNLTVEEVKVMDLGFEFTDHQPVFIRIRPNYDPLHTCSESCKQKIKTLEDSISTLVQKKNHKTKKK